MTVLLFPACGAHQEIKQAIEARRISDSLLEEFNKVNDRLKAENERIKARNASVHAYDSISIDSLKKKLETGSK